MELEIDVRANLIESAWGYAPFDKGKEVLEEKGYNLISLPQNAYLRIQQGPRSYISRNANWVREGFVYVSKKEKFLTRDSPIIEDSKKATRSSRKRRNYVLTREQTEKALVNSVRVFDGEIPTNSFGENEMTKYAFGEFAEQYGEFLREAGIKKIEFWLSDPRSKPFAEQVWFRSLFDNSILFSDGEDLHDDRRLRGIKLRKF